MLFMYNLTAGVVQYNITAVGVSHNIQSQPQCIWADLIAALPGIHVIQESNLQIGVTELCFIFFSDYCMADHPMIMQYMYLITS